MTPFLPDPNIDVKAFSEGYRAFAQGSRAPYRFTTSQFQEVKRRAKLIRYGQDRRAESIANKLAEQGVFLVDYWDQKGSLIRTLGERIHIASNPYAPGEYAAKEWERGFNNAYFHNLRNRRKRRF